MEGHVDINLSDKLIQASNVGTVNTIKNSRSKNDTSEIN